MAELSTLLNLGGKVSNFASKCKEYKSTRQTLESTTKDLGPLVEEIGQRARENDNLQTGEVVEKMKKVKASQEVLEKNKIHWWNFFRSSCFEATMDKNNQSIRNYFSVQMQALIVCDLEKIMSMLISIANSQSTLSQGPTIIRTQTFKVNVEVFPEFTVGLYGRFMQELKFKLLLGHEQVLNLHGLPGSGKTTLAKKLCHDPKSNIVKGCKHLPLALEFIGRELKNKGIQKLRLVHQAWSCDERILDWHLELLDRLQKSLDLLVNNSLRECFMDLGLFPEDQNIPVSALIDIWTELHDLDEQGLYAMSCIYDLIGLNLAAGIKVRRKVGSVLDDYYNNHFLVQHDLFRELAIRISNQERFEDRARLIIDMYGNRRPDWWPQQQQQQGIAAHTLSLFTKWFKDPNQKRVSAPILSISTDQNINPDWFNIQADGAIVMVLNLKTAKYILPEFVKKMRNLRVLIVTNYGHRTTELSNIELLESLLTLKRIRMQGVSVPPLCRLKNVCKLSLYMCEVKRFFENSSIVFSEAMPNLVDLNIEYCKDLVKLPAGFCDTTALKKLSISHCHKFTELPQEIWKLENLELLRISYCADFEKMPESITKLRNLIFLDISNCVSIRKLPDDIGELRNLRKFYMSGSPIRKLPDSIIYLEKLESVICDENAYGEWGVFKSCLSGLNIKMETLIISLNWLS